MVVKNPLTLKFLSACKFKSKLYFKMESTNDILLKIIEKASELYPNSVSKKVFVLNQWELRSLPSVARWHRMTNHYEILNKFYSQS